MRPPPSALRVTLHALRDRLPAEAVAHLGAELPMLVRGLYYEGWHPSAEALRAAHEEDFLDSLRRGLKGHQELQDLERVARAVFAVLDERLAPGQAEHALNALPKPVRCLWRDVQAEGDERVR